MTAAKRYSEEDRAKALSMFCGPAKEFAPSKMSEPQRPKVRVFRRGKDVIVGERVKTFSTVDEADRYLDLLLFPERF